MDHAGWENGNKSIHPVQGVFGRLVSLALLALYGLSVVFLFGFTLHDDRHPGGLEDFVE